MDAELLRLRAHIDQSQSEMRRIVVCYGADELAALIKTCAAGRLGDLDDRCQLFVGMLVVISIFHLIEEAHDRDCSA